MRISLIIVIAVSALVSHEMVEGARTKRSIGEWFSGFFKKFKKKPARRPAYAQLSYSIPQPSYHQAPVYHQQSYFAPAPVSSHGSYGLGGGHHGGGGGGHHGGGGGHHGGGGGGHHGGGGGQYGGNAGGHHGGGGGGVQYGGSGGGQHGGFGPLKQDDIIFHEQQSGGGYSNPGHHGGGGGGGGGDSYGSSSLSVPSSSSFGPPSHNLLAPAPAPSYVAPAPSPANTYVAPAPAPSNSYIAPAQSDSGFGPPKEEYRIPTPHTLPMSPHEPSESTYLDSSNIASAPAPLFQVGSNSFESPAPNLGYQSHIPSGQPLALSTETDYKAPVQAVSGTSTGYFPAPAQAPAPIPVQPPAPISQTAFASPSNGAGTFAVSLEESDPIIEIVFEDPEPGSFPPSPAPSYDPALFEPQEEEVEVYFIEYSPNEPIDNIQDLSLDGAQRAILEDLPEELPADIREQLVSSGVLDDALIQVVDLKDGNFEQALGSLGPNELDAIKAAYGAESKQIEIYEEPPPQAVDVRVHRLLEDINTPKGTAELLRGFGEHTIGQYIGTVKVNDKNAKSFLPLKIDGKQFPLVEHPDIINKPIKGVLVVAQSEEDTEGSVLPNYSTNEAYNTVPDISQSSLTKKTSQISRSYIDSQDTSEWIPIIRS